MEGVRGLYRVSMRGEMEGVRGLYRVSVGGEGVRWRE